MLNTGVLKLRLSQYGLVWGGVFLLVLLVTLAATLALKMDFVAVADPVLGLALGALGALLAVFAVATLIAPERLATKLVLLLLGAALALPLLWSPVLAVVITAYLSHAAVEYSAVYADFRAVISRIVYPLAQLVFGGSLIETVWSGFQIVATVVGFIASLMTLWPVLRRTMGGGGATETV